MSKSYQFDMEFELDGDKIRISGTIAPGYPATGPTWDCGGEPGEATHVEDHKVFGPDRKEIEDGDEKILLMFEDKIVARWERESGPEEDW